MHRNEVALVDQLVDFAIKRDSEFPRPLFRKKRVIADDLHLERQRPLCECYPDSAESDHCQRFPGKLRTIE